MDHTRLELEPGLWLDARRAVWIAATRTLAVADLHLGYAWAHRCAGNLLPLSAREDSAERLLALIESYAPHEVVLLGDIVHRAVPVPALAEELWRLCRSISQRARLRMVSGNHDKKLAALLRSACVSCALEEETRIGSHTLLHGDAGDALALLAEAQASGGRVIFGHEHPAISLSSGAGNSAKCACFLAGPNALLLPAFSAWAAGSNVRSGRFLSALATTATWSHAIAIVAGKLLPVRL